LNATRGCSNGLNFFDRANHQHRSPHGTQMTGWLPSCPRHDRHSFMALRPSGVFSECQSESSVSLTKVLL
jgi:hypothetical protein